MWHLNITHIYGTINTYHITTEDDKRGAGERTHPESHNSHKFLPWQTAVCCSCFFFVHYTSSIFTLGTIIIITTFLEQDVHPLPCRLLLLLLVAWPFHNVTASESQCARVPICKSCSHLCACWLPLQSLSFSHNCCCWWICYPLWWFSLRILRH